MIKRIIFAAFAIALLQIAPLQAQTVGVILSNDGTAVVGANPAGTQISTSDSRWVAWQNKWGPTGSVANSGKYNTAYAALIVPGFALTSSSLSCSPCYFPVDATTQENLTARYQQIIGDAIAVGQISGTALTVSSLVSGTITNNGYVYGSGVTPGTQITSGSGSSWVVNNSQTVGSEYLFIGGLGTGWSTGSSTGLVDVSGSIHFFNPTQFLSYTSALGALAACSFQAWSANGNSFPSNCNLAATIP